MRETAWVLRMWPWRPECSTPVLPGAQRAHKCRQTLAHFQMEVESGRRASECPRAWTRETGRDYIACPPSS